MDYTWPAFMYSQSFTPELRDELSSSIKLSSSSFLSEVHSLSKLIIMSLSLPSETHSSPIQNIYHPPTQDIPHPQKDVQQPDERVSFLLETRKSSTNQNMVYNFSIMKGTMYWREGTIIIIHLM